MEEAKKYKVEKRTKWECPEANDARVLTMPNLPKPTHGPNMQPRTIFGAHQWDITRKKCYVKAGYKCEACGADVSASGAPNCHELFDIDYKKGTSTFARCICLCRSCHILTIHSGRAITLYKHGSPLYPAKALLDAAEKSFSLIHDWNVRHPYAPELKMYATFLDYLKQEELRPAMEELIQRYSISFWREDEKKMAKWGDWKVVIGGKEYPTPYKTYEDWEKAMEELSKTDSDRLVSNPFVGGAFAEINKLIAKNESTKGDA